MNRTTIEWTDFTANPLRFRSPDGQVVWACVKVSPGCTNCYAEHLSTRYGGIRRAGEWNQGVMDRLTPFLDEAELGRMLRSPSIAGKRVFVGDMTDVFGAWVPEELLDHLFAVFALRQDVTWQVLTKRADRMREYLSDHQFGFRVGHNPLEAAERNAAAERVAVDIMHRWTVEGLPLPNVWLGVSAEDQQRADERIPLLLQTPAAVRFISAEPLLGPVDLRTGGEVTKVGHIDWLRGFDGSDPAIPGLDWVIVGGESGAGARPCDLRWIERIVSDCEDAEVPVFVKQVGALPYTYVNPGPSPDWPGDLRAYRNSPAKMDAIAASQGRMVNTIANDEIRDAKGGDPSEWPVALRVREFPHKAVPA